MAVTTGTSFILSTISAVLVFSGMQIYKPWFVSSQFHTLFGGYLGCIFFTFCLTAIGNLETCWFGKNFQVKLFPEVTFSLILALFATATIHRVCGTTCLLLSLCALYYISKYSQTVYATPVAPPPVQIGRRKKNA